MVVWDKKFIRISKSITKMKEVGKLRMFKLYAAEKVHVN